MTTVMTGSNRLPVLQDEIRQAHKDARDAAKTAVDRARDAGMRLIEAKALLKHGEWLPWLDETGLSIRTAQKYMRIARMPEAKYAATAHLTIDRALDAVADIPEHPALLWLRATVTACDQVDLALDALESAVTAEEGEEALKSITETCTVVIKTRKRAIESSKEFWEEFGEEVDAYVNDDLKSLSKSKKIVTWIEQYYELVPSLIQKTETFGDRSEDVMPRAFERFGEEWRTMARAQKEGVREESRTPKSLRYFNDVVTDN